MLYPITKTNPQHGRPTH